MTYCFLNGKILPLEEARVSVRDIGLVRGFGVYDGIAVYGGEPFRLDDHMRRFEASAMALGLQVRYSAEEIRETIIMLVEKNAFRNPVFKLFLTGGECRNHIEFDPEAPTFFMLTEEYVKPAVRFYSNGAKLILDEHQRSLPQIKTTNYIAAVIVQKRLKEEGALEALYFSKGNVLECTTSNFFIVKGGKLVTPYAGVLHGITRKSVMELAKENGYETEERDISVEETLAADEAFITSSFKEIVPVVDIEGNVIGGGTPGKITQEMIALFAEYHS